MSCNRIWICGLSKCRDCGSSCVEKFDPVKHAKRIIGNSNAWIRVWNEWKNHPRLKAAAEERAKNYNYGAASAINLFVKKLLEDIEK
jgi:hypothetical protein